MRALFSLFDTSGAAEFAGFLSSLGWEIIASRETVSILSKNNIPVLDVADFTGVKVDYGFPPTLHPKIESYLTSTKGERIDLVYVNPYPLSVGNDVGGRTLLALAAKGNRLAVMTKGDMELVINELRADNQVSERLRQGLLDKANALIASHYDDLLKERLPRDLIIGEFQYGLLNGENPYQSPAQLFSIKEADTLSLPKFRQISGEPPCFTNLADADCLIQTMCLAAEAFSKKHKKIPFICIAAKHGNACGMGISWEDPSEAVNIALFGNARSIWGGEVIVNFEVDQNLAGLLYKSHKRKEMYGDENWMLDVILAPAFAQGALGIIGKRQGRKLFENKALLSPNLTSAKYSYRFLRGGFLRQPPHNFVLDLSEAKQVGSKPDKGISDPLIIAWSTAFSSNHGGNEIAIAGDLGLIGVGGGPSTVDAARIAVERAKICGHKLEGASFAANAFFPFTDAPQILSDAGLKAGVVPAGGKNEELVREFFKAKGLTMFYLAQDCRGFSRH